MGRKRVRGCTLSLVVACELCACLVDVHKDWWSTSGDAGVIHSLST